MTIIAAVRIAAAARADLGEPSPENTCCSLGMNKWPQDVGLPGIGTNSVTEARQRARAGHNGWSYHDGMDGVRIGDFPDWAGDDIHHVTVVEDIDDGGRIRSIGAGGPTGKVWWQPRTQGYNDRTVFKGYFRAPAEKPATRPVKTTKPRTQPVPVVKGRTYTVQDGDTLWSIARRRKTSVNAILRRNRDVIRSKDHIEVGWVLQLP